jgi:hypothetical protein
MSHAFLKGPVPAFPKPRDARILHRHLIVHRDGREVCITALNHPLGAEGRAEYKRRLEVMWERQKGYCCLHGFIAECPGKLLLGEATFEHENGRAGGKRDDRVELPDGTWINGAAHMLCNGIKGSVKIFYNRTLQREHGDAR